MKISLKNKIIKVLGMLGETPQHDDTENLEKCIFLEDYISVNEDRLVDLLVNDIENENRCEKCRDKIQILKDLLYEIKIESAGEEEEIFNECMDIDTFNKQKTFYEKYFIKNKIKYEEEWEKLKIFE